MGGGRNRDFGCISCRRVPMGCGRVIFERIAPEFSCNLAVLTLAAEPTPPSPRRNSPVYVSARFTILTIRNPPPPPIRHYDELQTTKSKFQALNHLSKIYMLQRPFTTDQPSRELLPQSTVRLRVPLRVSMAESKQ